MMKTAKFALFASSTLVACGAGPGGVGGQRLVPHGASVDEVQLAPRSAVEETRFGVHHVDEFRWMEEDRSPKVAAWLTAQGSRTRRALDGNVGRAELSERLRRNHDGERRVTSLALASGSKFFLRHAPQSDRELLFVRDARGAERELVNPVRFDAEGGPVTVAVFVPSPDGKYVAVGLTASGDENVTVRIVVTSTGEMLPDRIEHVVGGEVSWLPGGGALLASHLPFDPATVPPEERTKNVQVVVHSVGGSDPSTDVAIIGKSVPGIGAVEPDDFPTVRAYPGSPFALAILQRGVSDEMAVYAKPAVSLKDNSIPWRPVIGWKEGVTSVTMLGDVLYAQSHRRKSAFEIEARSLARSPERGAPTTISYVSEMKGVITALARTPQAVYVSTLDIEQSHLYRITRPEARAQELELPWKAAIQAVVASPSEDRISLQVEGWTRSRQWLEAREPDHVLGVLDLGAGAPAAFADVVVERLEAVSKDGTRVPLTVLRPSGKRATAPSLVWLVAYGAYGESLAPTFVPASRVWFELGGVMAFAHVRGGGELGEEWHQAGTRERKVNSIDDFIACAEKLGSVGLAPKGELLAFGASAGGITVGGAMVKRPDLFRAVVLSSAIANPLRLEATPIGGAHEPELGAMTNEKEWKALLAIDPYENVKKGARYPGLLAVVGMNDPRVPPWQSAKLAARLMADAPTPDRDVLIRVEAQEGHVTSTQSQLDRKNADIMTFFLWQAGASGFRSSVSKQTPHP